MDRVRKWTKNEIIELFQQGKSFDEVKSITGLPGRRLGGVKGFLNSPMYRGPPISPEVKAGPTGARLGQSQPRLNLGAEAGSWPQGGVTQPEEYSGGQVGSGVSQVEASSLISTTSTEAPSLTKLQGRPYLIPVRNVCVSPDVLKCYQLCLAKGFNVSIGEFFESCVLKLFETRCGLVPAMIRLPENTGS